MALFQSTSTLKILILWAGAKRKAWALEIRDVLRNSAPPKYDFRIITEDHSDSRYDELSEAAIDAADCVLLIAAHDDWKDSDSAIREYEYFNTLTRERKKTPNQFRFVRVNREQPPKYANGGKRPLSFADPKAVSQHEINNALDYFDTIERSIGTLGDAPLRIDLTKEMLLSQNGLLIATIWAVTLDDEVFQNTPATDVQAPQRNLIGALRRLKALHSIHSGIGAMIRDPISAFSSKDFPAGLYDIERLRKPLFNTLQTYKSPNESSLNDALDDCIRFGILPTLELFARRLNALPNCLKAREFVEAAIGRLNTIPDERRTILDVEQHDGHWWIDRYYECQDFVDTKFNVIVSDEDISELLRPNPRSDLGVRELSETLIDAKNLLAATVLWAFTMLVVFSFLRAHRPACDEDLQPESAVALVEQLVEDWRRISLVDAVVKRSNQMILRLLAAARDDESLTHAAA